MIDKTKTYVFLETEVKLTGRVAKKPSTMNANIMLIQYEVQPADDEAVQWKKWAKEADLFIIEDSE
jgi:hypothetical protein